MYMCIVKAVEQRAVVPPKHAGTGGACLVELLDTAVSLDSGWAIPPAKYIVAETFCLCI